VVVLGLPRGGVPVASVVANELDAPLDVIVVRKLGVPSHPELAMGAIGEGGVRIVNEEVVRGASVTAAQFAEVEAREREELARQARLFRGARERARVAGKTVIIVDDGIATGSTAWAACAVVRAVGASRVVLATPVGAQQSIEDLHRVADEVVCLETPEPFNAVGQWYRDFSATSDAEVQALLRRPAAYPGHDVGIPGGSIRLPGILNVPDGSSGLVVFAHGSGSSRKSPRNRWVAEFLNGAGFATLLFDLLTPAEQLDRTNVFDIDLLGQRLGDATRWVAGQPDVRDLPLGYFGASTGAAAALWAASEPDLDVSAVVCRGGRPDLATERLYRVIPPTLLIVGGRDTSVLNLNVRAARMMRSKCRVKVVPGATHLFDEPGTLQAAAELARDWFALHFGLARTQTRWRRTGCATSSATMPAPTAGRRQVLRPRPLQPPGLDGGGGLRTSTRLTRLP
jgi:putative phosphoribosyl transferase